MFVIVITVIPNMSLTQINNERTKTKFKLKRTIIKVNQRLLWESVCSFINDRRSYAIHVYNRPLRD